MMQHDTKKTELNSCEAQGETSSDGVGAAPVVQLSTLQSNNSEWAD
jgi:hypothetical protein